MMNFRYALNCFLTASIDGIEVDYLVFLVPHQITKYNICCGCGLNQNLGVSIADLERSESRRRMSQKPKVFNF